MKNKLFSILLCAGIFFYVVSVTPAFATAKTVKRGQDDIPLDSEPVESETVSLPSIVMVDENRLKIGDIIIDRKERFVSMEGEINMAEGLVEYFASSGEGKLHESVLKIYAQPYHIQIALLLLGLEPGNQPIEYQGANEKPCGDPVRIMVSWQTNGEYKEVPAEDLVFNRATDKSMGKTVWVFTGSKIMDGNYMAQVEGSIVSTFHDPFAILDHRSDTGADDTLFFANEKLLPSKGTKVVMKIFAEKDPAIKKATSCK